MYSPTSGAEGGILSLEVVENGTERTPYLLCDGVFDKVKIYKMNIDENPMTPQKYGIRGIPTIMIFKNGELIDTKVGSLPKTALETWIQSNL